MKKEELPEGVEITYNESAGLSMEEQETVINWYRVPFDGNMTFIDTTDQTMITKLLKSDYFVMSKALVSNHPRNEGYVLGICGGINDGISIRSKKRVYTEEDKQRARGVLDRVRSNMGGKE